MIVISAGLYLYQDSLTKAFHFDYITRFLIFFLLGAFAIRYASLIANLGFGSLLASLIAFIALQWGFHGYSGLLYTDTGSFSLLLAVEAIFLIVSLSVLLAKTNLSYLRRLGELSMVIYLMHILAASGLRIILTKFMHISHWPTQAIAGTLFGLLAPVIAYALIQRLHLTFLLDRPRFNNPAKKIS